MPHRIAFLLLRPALLGLLLLSGCAAQRDMEGMVRDPEFRWERVGFSVTAPQGSNWYRLPNDSTNTRVAFRKGEGLYFAEQTPKNTVYIKGETVSASAILLSQHVKDRSEKEKVAQVLEKNLERALRSIKQTATKTKYDATLGADCVKYQADTTVKRIDTERGEMHIDGIYGYICLHPDRDDFGVMMQASNYGTVWTDIRQRRNHADFFTSLRFLPVSSSTISRLRHKK